ncbi:hypothetical protein BMAFMH_E0483, partial [Burkholderia mallei FMH]
LSGADAGCGASATSAPPAPLAGSAARAAPAALPAARVAPAPSAASEATAFSAPGGAIRNTWPMPIRVRRPIRFQACSSRTVQPFACAIADSVSPRLTT